MLSLDNDAISKYTVPFDSWCAVVSCSRESTITINRSHSDISCVTLKGHLMYNLSLFNQLSKGTILPEHKQCSNESFKSSSFLLHALLGQRHEFNKHRALQQLAAGECLPQGKHHHGIRGHRASTRSWQRVRERTLRQQPNRMPCSFRREAPSADQNSAYLTSLRLLLLPHINTNILSSHTSLPTTTFCLTSTLLSAH